MEAPLLARELTRLARKKRCPKCGSKKVKGGREWQCATCGYTWSGTAKKSKSRKDKVRF
jgi:ribosomal protein L37AE/L43A